MRGKLLVALLAAALAPALSLPSAGEPAGVTSRPMAPAIVVPQPPPPIFNPGVAPSAPAPSAITPSPSSSAGLATTVMPGPATGRSRARGSRARANRDQTRAVNEMQKEIDRGISICRGC